MKKSFMTLREVWRNNWLNQIVIAFGILFVLTGFQNCNCINGGGYSGMSCEAEMAPSNQLHDVNNSYPVIIGADETLACIDLNSDDYTGMLRISIEYDEVLEKDILKISSTIQDSDNEAPELEISSSEFSFSDNIDKGNNSEFDIQLDYNQEIEVNLNRTSMASESFRGEVIGLINGPVKVYCQYRKPE